MSRRLVPWLLGLSVVTVALLPANSQPPSLPNPSVDGQSQPASPVRPVVPLVRQPTAQPGVDDQLWSRLGQRGDRQALVTAIDHSLRYLQTPKSLEDYRKQPVPGITHSRVVRSLQRFRHLLLASRSATDLQTRVRREFVLYQAIGRDNRGTVGFTGYYEPVHPASRLPTATFRYPLYRLPPDFATWTTPHPTRLELEGVDGLQSDQGRLRGLELVWLRDRLEAYLVQVQGSARLKLTDGTTMTVGYAGATNYPYVSLGKELIKAGKFKPEALTLPVLIQYFQRNPAELNIYLPLNQRFIFFKETQGMPATGSLSVPVTAERSIATDKSLFPPGALALIQTQIPYAAKSGKLTLRSVNRYVLDQDTGSAIKGPGRVDVFMGTGQRAGDRAGLINGPGKLYYLLLKSSDQ